MIDLRQLRAFVTVAETEHVGMAAERLHISQSPLSRQIIKLEAQLGLALFERVKQRVRLTDGGRRFLPEARALLAQAERAESNAQRLGRGEAGAIAIGYVDAAIQCGVLPALLNRYTTTRPAVQIALHAQSSASQIDALQRRAIDFGLLYSPPSHMEDALISRQVARDRLMLAVPAAHALAQADEILPAMLDSLPWIAMRRALNPAARDRFLAACHASGFAPDIRFEVAERLTVLGLVRAGLGVALVQAGLRSVAPEGVVFREVPWFPLVIQVHAVWRRGESAPLVTALLDDMRAIVGHEAAD